MQEKYLHSTLQLWEKKEDFVWRCKEWSIGVITGVIAELMRTILTNEEFVTNEEIMTRNRIRMMIHQSYRQSYQRSYRTVDANNINHCRHLTDEKLVWRKIHQRYHQSYQQSYRTVNAAKTKKISKSEIVRDTRSDPDLRLLSKWIAGVKDDRDSNPTLFE